MAFKRAEKKKAKLRLALIGPSGSGKTYSALAIGTTLGAKVAVIDTEGGSANDYADKFVFDEETLRTFSPKTYIEKIKEAEDAGYDVIIIDSLSHAWFGTEGALEMVNKEALRSRSGNTYFAWKNVTPLHNSLINTIIQSPCHIIATMRAKEKYVIDDDGGKQKPRKLGLEAIQREGMNYEFTFAGDMDMDHNLIISKTRWDELDGAVINKPGKEFANRLLGWLDSGVADSSFNGSSPQEQAAITTQKAQTKEIIEQKEANGTIVTAQPDSELATKERSLRVQDHLAKVRQYLTKSAIEKPEEVVEAANFLINLRFDVESPEDVPDEKFEELQAYTRTNVLSALKEESLIK